MSAPLAHRPARIGTLLLASALPACDAVIGADFDVALAPDASCPLGRCASEIPNEPYPWAVAVDEQAIYWTNAGLPRCGEGVGEVVRHDKATATRTVLASGQTCPIRLALTEDYVYWTTFEGCPAGGCPDGGAQTGGQVLRIRKDGTSAAPAVIADGQQGPAGLAVDATHVYWVTQDGFAKRKLLDGSGSEEALNTHQDALNAFSILALDDTYAYFSSFIQEGGGVYRVPKSPPAGELFPTRLGGEFANPNGLALADGLVLFVTFASDGAVYAVPAAGDESSDVTVLAPNQSMPADITTDGAAAYWTNTGDGSVWRVPMPYGSGAPLAQHSGPANSLCVDDTNVYWTVHEAQGSVLVVPKGG